MCSRQEEQRPATTTTTRILFAVRYTLPGRSLAAFLIIIVVGFIPFPFGTLGSGGGASAELSLPAGACVREPQEASRLGGGLREGRLQTSPLSWVTREGVLGEHRLTGHISRILTDCAKSDSQEALWLSLKDFLTRPSTPSLQQQWRIPSQLRALSGAMVPPLSGRFLLLQEAHQEEP